MFKNKKSLGLIILCGIILCGICGCGKEYDRNKILNNEENTKAYCKGVLQSGEYEMNLIGNNEQTVLNGHDEMETLDKYCSVQKKKIMGKDKKADFSCEHKQDNIFIVEYEYLLHKSISESVKELEGENYNCIIYSENNTDEKILGTWCEYQSNGTLTKGNNKITLNRDGTMIISEDFGDSWGKSEYSSYYSFENDTLSYLMENNNYVKLELKYNSNDNTLSAGAQTYWKKCN